jgi:hypothetical protein
MPSRARLMASSATRWVRWRTKVKAHVSALICPSHACCSGCGSPLAPSWQAPQACKRRKAGSVTRHGRHRSSPALHVTRKTRSRRLAVARLLAVVRDHVLDLAGRDSHDVDSVADHVAGNTKNATGRALDYAGCGRALTATTPPLDSVTCLLAIQLVKDLIGSSSLGRCEGEFSHFFGIERSCHDS